MLSLSKLKKINEFPVVSIIIATVGRITELRRLFNSIKNSSYSNIEIVIVDQNEEGYLSQLLVDYVDDLNIKHIYSIKKGVAINKNIGFGHCSGDIITFSDDDSFYELDTIANAVSLLGNFDAISGRAWCPLINQRSLIRSQNSDANVNSFNFFSNTIEFTMFWKRETLEKVGLWDEMLGVGGIWGSEGGADLVIRCLKEQMKIRYFANLKIFHENQNVKNSEKIYSYSRGHGALIAKSIFVERNWRFLPYSTVVIIASLIKVPMYFLLRNTHKKTIYLNRLLGLVNGFKTYYLTIK